MSKPVRYIIKLYVSVLTRQLYISFIDNVDVVDKRVSIQYTDLSQQEILSIENIEIEFKRVLNL